LLEGFGISRRIIEAIKNSMKTLKTLTVTLLSLSILAGPLAAMAGDASDTKAAEQKTNSKLKPYTLKTCIVSGDKLGEMGEPYVYEYEGREIKFCCKGCLKDFKKEPAKYVKKIKEAEAKAKK
jgi:YHS domain-containing protein